MFKPWRLTRRAEGSLVEIALWTMETFGPRQAAAYEEDLIARCEEIANGTAPSHDCSQLVGGMATEHLRYARAGQHFVVYVEAAETVFIIDFLHARSDLPRRLAALNERLRADQSGR